jgi:hypothetical protein
MLEQEQADGEDEQNNADGEEDQDQDREARLNTLAVRVILG